MEQREDKNCDNSYIANKKTPLQKVGEFLKEARQGRNISIEDLSSSLRIGKEQLIALEEGKEESLPEKVFIKAMVRRIAEKLNLDTNFILKELNEKKKNEPKKTSLINKKQHKKNKDINPLSMIILPGILGLIASILALRFFEKSQNNSIKPETSEVFLLDKNKILK